MAEFVARLLVFIYPSIFFLSSFGKSAKRLAAIAPLLAIVPIVATSRKIVT